MKRKTIISIIMFILLIGISNISFGAIEIKPGTTPITLTTVSNSYLKCRELTTTVGESLYGASTLQPHLATNSDWGAVSYLSNSAYGTNTAGQNKGTEITINSVKYYSTNGNVTGVMNWGVNPNATRYTQTAGLISTYDSSTSTASANVTELYNNRETRFVDFINPGTATLTKGMAMQETSGQYSGGTFSTSTQNNYPGSIRSGLISGIFGYGSYGVASGVAANNVTFRPVIWNK